MSEKRSVWELLLKDSVQNKLNALNGAADKVSAKFTGLQNNINKTEIALKGISNEIPGMSRGLDLLSNPMLLVGAGVAAVGAGLYKSTKLAFDFETGMAKINATAQLGEEDLGRLHDRLNEIGSKSGGNFELIPAAYEKILSQTGKVNLSLDILQTAVKGAKAGFTDIDTLSSAVAQSLSSIGEKNATAAQVLDTFMMAKKVGAGEFKDFAQYLPQLIAGGKNLAMSYQDTAGMFAFMTAKGQSAADTAMLMNNAFTALQKNDVLKGLESKGIKLFDASGMRRNIKDVFLDLTRRLDGLNDRRKSQFFIDIGLNDEQAKTAFSVLTSDGERFKEIMGDVNDSLGETNRQLENTANTARTWGDVGDTFKSIAEQIGQWFLPVIDWIGQKIQGAIALFKDVFSNWGDRKKENILESMNAQLADNAAAKLTKQKYGIDIKDGGLHSENQINFYKSAAQDFFDKANGHSKNDIVKGETGALKNPFAKSEDSKGGDKKFKDGLDQISGGGKQTRNVIVNITKLVENINIHAATVKESSTDLTRQIEEIVLRAIQGSELALGNS